MTKGKLKKIYLAILGIFVLLTIGFYFIAGEQLWYKESTSNIEMLEADSISEQLRDGLVIRQKFLNTVDKIESIELVFTKNYQECDGHLTIDLLDGNYLLYRESFKVEDIPEQHRIYLNPNEPIIGKYDKQLTLKLYANSSTGAYAMMNGAAEIEGRELYVDDEHYGGTICFAIKGSEEITTASYYWFIMSGIGCALAILFYISYKKYSKNQYDYLAYAIDAVFKYEFLISQLVSRDFKSKYKRSVFGIFWSFLNPLLTMVVQFLVFSTLFKTDTKNYPVYLIVGVVCFSFFNECTTMCLNSIAGSARLITKVYIPKYIFPLSKCMSSSINLGIAMIPLLLVAIVTGTTLHWSFFLMFYFLICLIIFSLGIGMILASLMVFFKDIQFLWSVFLTIWQYATPIFYPAEIIPERFQFVVKLNPLYHFIGNARKCLINGISPEPKSYIFCLMFALASLLFGSFIFKKCQDKFTLYL